MATRRSPKVFTALDSFYYRGTMVTKGDTVIEGHPILKGRKNLFTDFAPTFGTLPVEEDEPEPAPAPEPEAEAS